MPKVKGSELGQKLRAAGAEPPGRRGREPLWRGPEVDGITQSLLSRFLSCRERFRVMVIEGLAPADYFNHRVEYGNLWHACEEALAADVDWQERLRGATASLMRRYPGDRDKVAHWAEVCRTQFPVYAEYWQQHEDVLSRQPVLQETSFNVPCRLLSGRVVRLRGKWDAVDLIGGRLWLQENKTKGDVRPDQLRRQLTFDLQTMLYLVALEETRALPKDQRLLGIGVPRAHEARLGGVRYNVIRRPLAGGRGSIVQRKGEGRADFYERLGGVIAASPQEFFWRWNVDITQEDVLNFRRRFLDPILEQLCDWWEWMRTVAESPGFDPFGCEDGRWLHWQHPFGVYNILDEGGSSDLDEYLSTGSEVGLRRADTLFPELE